MNNSFKLSKKQTKAWKLLFDMTTLFVGYGGGAFSGKSYLMCHWLTYCSMTFPGTAWGLGRKELITLKKTTLVTLFKVFNEVGSINEKHYHYNQQLNKIVFKNGSVIYLIDTAYKPSDPLYQRFGGLELTGCAIDESAETDRKAIDILFTRLGRCLNDHYKLKKKMLECFNPAKTHVYDRYYKPHRNNEETLETKFVPALPKDNPSPEVPDYIDGILKTADTVTIERLIYGNFEYDDNPNALFDYDSILDSFTNSFIKRTGIKYLSADIAYLGSDLFVIGIWDGLILEKVIPIEKIDETLIGQKIEELRIKYKVPAGNVIYDADGLRKFVKHSAKTGLLRLALPFVNNSIPLKVEGKNEQYKNLKAQCYFKLAEMMKANLMYIEDQTYRDQIISDLENINRLPLNDDGKLALERKVDLKERIGRSPDYSDMMMFRMWYEIKGVKKKKIIW